ncbi:uncharacterized protein N7479_008345 [Penicillium vulpinum]|uniref:NAD dependent epimerase/dehydratase n=1 Tax=Penicillium vulpinum TaxID=29845 RepID=A0A1V6R9K0_9EURO|nr:uncharacterized protein N7479_008345 [Penicillium vulpinum]KAJ5961195.1 hypothetical protein N7479_008345 [Penicillium vulpinum]OQD98205.1 hypothetical protein PENVUL_c075G03825 [Penicillium vulpinum]
MGQKASVPKQGTQIQVIGAGLPRTGTSSFSEALEILLNGPVYHCGTQISIGPPTEIKSWMPILQSWLKQENSTSRTKMLTLLRHRLAGYVAITDSPGSELVPELMELYPDAKVICTVRDPILWETSMLHVQSLTGVWFARAVLLPLDGMRHFIPYGYLLAALWERLYGGVAGQHGRETYVSHVAWLKKVVPEDRLVFFDVRDGWGPLCKALGVEAPVDVPFPRVNDSEAIERSVNYHFKRGLTRWACIFAVLGVGAAAFRMWK